MKKKMMNVGKALLIVGVMGVTLLIPMGADKYSKANREIVGKCTLTIDASKHISNATRAIATGDCGRIVSGIYYSAPNRFDMIGGYTGEVKTGDVHVVTVPPYGSYEVTVITIPLNGTPPPVKPEPKPLPTGQVFKDVPKSFWGYREINNMEGAGIVYGYPDGTYKPHLSISRRHVAALFVRSMDLVPIREGKEFKDVPKGHNAYNDVQKVYRAGIFDGMGNGNFGIESNLTRAQMAKVLVYAFDIEVSNGENQFNDVKDDHWAKDYITTIYQKRITVGSNGSYFPNDYVTRAQYAAFLHRSLEHDGMIFPSKVAGD